VEHNKTGSKSRPLPVTPEVAGSSPVSPVGKAKRT
jgi:hypothetical protein